MPLLPKRSRPNAHSSSSTASGTSSGSPPKMVKLRAGALERRLSSSARSNAVGNVTGVALRVLIAVLALDVALDAERPDLDAHDDSFLDVHRASLSASVATGTLVRIASGRLLNAPMGEVAHADSLRSRV